MIELNLTYEESKKIFELGYDFSKVCDFAWVTMNTNETPVLVCQNSEIQYLLFAQKIYDFQTALIKKQAIEIIPIIPKAALEKCLPELSGSTWLKNLRTNWVILDLDPHIIKLESIFKAFMWCHEHYPEELKKKFEEVMK